MKQHKIPVILYESEEQALPYIEVQEGEEMPKALFIQEYKHTGDYEPDDSGNEQPIVDMYIHMYVDMEVLSKKLPADLYDKVRVSIGLQPVKEAREEGQKKLNKVYDNVNKKFQEAHAQKDKIKEDLANDLNEKLADKFFESEDKEEEEK